MMTLFFIVDGGAMFYIIFQCKPVSYVDKNAPAIFLGHFSENIRGSQPIFSNHVYRYAWNTDQEGYCLPATWLADIYYVTTAVNIVTDWVTALL